ncbi:hypothetical protein [Sporosarcina sp. FSL K6-2383]|uniref:hypothetical protein n=1 Tax=Sporosarcina sp. FSL K6-2383 TaxID=2921556 RepID=UPI00315A2B42
MFKRKGIAFLLTVVLTIPMLGFSFMLIEGSGVRDALELMVFAAIYVTPVILLYGVPVSILSDKINDRFNGVKRVLLSLFTHLFLGLSFPLFFILVDGSQLNNGGNLYLVAAAVIPSFVFWGMDEVLRSRYLYSVWDRK